MSFIKPAGDFEADNLEAEGPKESTFVWCKTCARKHPRRQLCDLVEYQQGNEFDKVTDHPEHDGTSVVVRTRHPGRWMNKSLFETENA